MTATPASLPNPTALGARVAQGSPWRLVAGAMLLGTLGVFLHEAGQHPLTSVWFRCAFGALALAAWCATTGRLAELRLGRHGVLAAVGSGALMAISWALFFAAIERTSIALATVVFHVQPFCLMALAACWLKEPALPRQWAAAAVALVGLAFASGLLGNASASPGTVSHGLGLLLCLGAALSYAGVTLVARASGGVGPLALAWWQCVVGALLFLPWMLWQGWPPLGASWAWLAGLGMLHTGLAYVRLFTGMAGLAAGRIAVLQFVYPITAVIADWAVYGQSLDRVQLFGVALMAAALLGARRRVP